MGTQQLTIWTVQGIQQLKNYLELQPKCITVKAEAVMVQMGLVPSPICTRHSHNHK